MHVQQSVCPLTDVLDAFRVTLHLGCKCPTEHGLWGLAQRVEIAATFSKEGKGINKIQKGLPVLISA